MLIAVTDCTVASLFWVAAKRHNHIWTLVQVHHFFDTRNYRPSEASVQKTMPNFQFTAAPLDVTDKAAPPLDVTDKAAPPLDVTDKAAPPLLDVLCGQSTAK